MTRKFPLGSSSAPPDPVAEYDVAFISNAPGSLLDWWKRTTSMARGDEFTAVAGGTDNDAAHFAAIGGGHANIARGAFSTIPGGYGAATHLPGQFAHAAGAVPTAGPGSSQYTRIIANAHTSGHVVAFMQAGQTTPDPYPATAADILIPQDTAWILTAHIIARPRTHDGPDPSIAAFRLEAIAINAPGSATLHASTKTILHRPEGIAYDANLLILPNSQLPDGTTPLQIAVAGDWNADLHWTAVLDIVQASWGALAPPLPVP